MAIAELLGSNALERSLCSSTALAPSIISVAESFYETGLHRPTTFRGVPWC